MRKHSIIVAAVLWSSLTQAQEDTTSKALSEVVITATKYPVKLSETGKVVTVITKEQIEKSSGKDLTQLLNEQTGLIVNGANSNPGKDKSVFLRGASNKYTLILLDGVPVSDPSGVGGAFDLRLFPLSQIERIEILKGSQSTLYGSDAVAGVINIISRKGGNKKLGVTTGASYGSYNSFKGDAGLNGHAAIFDYNLNYSYSKSNGISEATDTTGKNNFDKDGFNRHAFQANVTVNASDKLKLSPYYRYTWYTGDFDADAFTDGSNKFASLLNNTGAVATYKLPKGSLTANYGYSYVHRSYTSAYGAYGFKGRFHTGDIYLHQALNQQVQLLGGVNYQSYQLLDNSLPAKNPETSIVSPYLSFLIQSNGLGLELGGRYNHHSRSGDHLTYSVNTSYAINNQVKFFANVSTGFKAPTITELFGFYGANDQLQPENATSQEGGVQAELWQKKVAITATAFNRDVTNLITYVAGRYINVDRQHDKGFELEANINPAERWNIKASYTYVTGAISQTRNSKDTSYFNLIRKPKNTLNLNAGYQATPQLYISVSTQTLSKRTDLFYEPVPPYDVKQVALKAYTVLNAYAEYKLTHKHLRLFVDAKNITNTKYTEVYGYNTLGVNINGGFLFTL